ncbi:type VI secretion system baseplate subunit TssK [Anatilimnocola floriformis]|uniref:type VI secretion system baseplate subunit TssK n=1 Tax=Anatilimnocola floriformis TaxID=2948575 RepID=UPI0020C2B59A|nr:type VI secretion system baseplate subunit TssK [Anatilimnocola floriformis]
MRNQPVYWYEGMFLRPQHFQAAERYWTEVNDVSEQIDHPYYYGLRTLSISRPAIANNQFQVTQLQARLKDGTIVHLEAGQDPDRLDLKESLTGKTLDAVNLAEAFEKEAKVRVFLAVPRLMLGRKNTGPKETSADARFGIDLKSIQDENEGGNDQEIEFRAMNVRLMLSTQNLTGYEVLPIGQVKRAGGAASAPELDAEYIPPLIAVESWPPLARDIIRVIYDRIGECIGVLADQISDMDVALASSDPLDMRRVFILLRLNEAYSVLGTQTFASGVHPYAAYQELCRVIGQLSIFSANRRPPEFPRYDHDNLFYIFDWLKKQIELLLQAIPDQKYVQRYFTGAGQGLQVNLEPQWLAEGWNWYIGVNRGSLSESDCRELLKPGAANLDWKFGSATMVDFYRRNFHRGVWLEELTTVPRILPAKGPWLYYQVKRDNEAWQYVHKEQSLAMRLNTHLIRNLESLQGKRDLVVSVRGQNVILQFALFAVKPF